MFCFTINSLPLSSCYIAVEHRVTPLAGFDILEVNLHWRKLLVCTRLVHQDYPQDFKSYKHQWERNLHNVSAHIALFTEMLSLPGVNIVLTTVMAVVNYIKMRHFVKIWVQNIAFYVLLRTKTVITKNIFNVFTDWKVIKQYSWKRNSARKPNCFGVTYLLWNWATYLTFLKTEFLKMYNFRETILISWRPVT